MFSQDTTQTKPFFIDDGSELQFYYNPLGINMLISDRSDTINSIIIDTISISYNIDTVIFDSVRLFIDTVSVDVQTDSSFVDNIVIDTRYDIWINEVSKSQERKYSRRVISIEDRIKELQKEKKSVNRYLKFLKRENPFKNKVNLDSGGTKEFVLSLYPSKQDLENGIKNKKEMVKLAEAFSLSTSGTKAVIADRIWNYINN